MSNSIFTALHDEGIRSILVSCEKGDVATFHQLLQSGVDPTVARGLNDYTALHYAASRGHSLIIQELLKLGMNPNMKNSDGETPLHLAVYAGNLMIVEQLIDNNADVNAVNHDNETALVYASSQGRPLIVRLLLQHGALVDIKDNIINETALDRAKDARTKEMFEMILKQNSANADFLMTSNTREIGTERSTINSLTYEVLLRIFDYLSIKNICQCGGVNSKWYRVSQDNNIWNEKVGMKRWEYALMCVVGITPTATSSLLTFKPKSSSSNGPSRGNSFKSKKSNTNNNSNSNSNIVIANNTELTDFL